MAAADELPHVDEHSVVVGAPPTTTWRSVAKVAETAFSPTWVGVVSRVLGCEDTSVTGPRPLTTGSTFPGFHVATDEPHRLVLLGAHRFSDYALIFRLDELDDGATRLRAETRAVFPGLHGGLYRAAVIGTRRHTVVVKRLLNTAKDHAERS